VADPVAEVPSWRFQRAPDRLVVDDVEVALRRDGAGETVLFLHGVGFLRQWLPFHAALTERVDLIAPEHPGFGDTPLPGGFRGFLDYVLHYDALLALLQADRLHLVGHGLGARLAAHMATVYPSRFASLTLIAPSGLRQEQEPLIDLFRMTYDALHAAQFNGREAAYADTYALKGFPQDTLDDVADAVPHALLTWTNRFDRRLERRLHRIQCPTLVIAPEQDRIGGTTAAARYAELVPGSALVTPAGPGGDPSSYAVLIEQPAEVAALVADHVDSTTKGN